MTVCDSTAVVAVIPLRSSKAVAAQLRAVESDVIPRKAGLVMTLVLSIRATAAVVKAGTRERRSVPSCAAKVSPEVVAAATAVITQLLVS